MGIDVSRLGARRPEAGAYDIWAVCGLAEGRRNMNELRYENGLATRKPKNHAEAACFDDLVRAGWTVTKKGWPDFFCIRGGEVCAVEVKPRACTPLKPNQRIVMEALKKHGIKCYRWDPATGFCEV